MTTPISARERMSIAARTGVVPSVGAPLAARQVERDPFLEAAAAVSTEAVAEQAARPPRPGVFTALAVPRTEPVVSAQVSAPPATDIVRPVELPRLTARERLAALGATPVTQKDGQKDGAPQSSSLSSPAPAEKALTARADATGTPAHVATARERLAANASVDQNSARVRKEMSAMRSLTRLLEAVFTRPGSRVDVSERIAALSTLSTQAFDLGTVVARVAGDDAERSQYLRAAAMDAAVGLVCKSWEQGLDVNWEALITASAEIPEVSRAAEEIAKASYRTVRSVSDASDRLAVSMHAAFWQVYGLGETVDGMTPRLAAEIVRDCSEYLHARDKFVSDNDMFVSWMQGSIRRMTDLVCAEIRSRFGGANAVPTQEDFQSVLEVARSGFEGVENYAQSILEKPNSPPVSRPADR